jgi:hypothetical protein
MLDILTKHLEEKASINCVVSVWIESLDDAEKEAFAKLKENNQNVVCASLYKDLHAAEPMPFGLTAFRSHLRGYCTCLKS